VASMAIVRFQPQRERGCLEALGVNLACLREKVEQSLQELKVAFLLPRVPSGHETCPGPAQGNRHSYGLNLLGPLTNPAERYSPAGHLPGRFNPAGGRSPENLGRRLPRRPRGRPRR